MTGIVYHDAQAVALKSLSLNSCPPVQQDKHTVALISSHRAEYPAAAGTSQSAPHPANAISFYSDERICEYLHFSLNGLWKAREGLVGGGFLLYSRPIYQLLNLPEPPRWE